MDTDRYDDSALIQMARENFFPFLDGVRNSGQMNMCGAPRLLRELYGLSRREATDIFYMWNDELKRRTSGQ